MIANSNVYSTQPRTGRDVVLLMRRINALEAAGVFGVNPSPANVINLATAGTTGFAVPQVNDLQPEKTPKRLVEFDAAGGLVGWWWNAWAACGDIRDRIDADRFFVAGDDIWRAIKHPTNGQWRISSYDRESGEKYSETILDTLTSTEHPNVGYRIQFVQPGNGGMYLYTAGTNSFSGALELQRLFFLEPDGVTVTDKADFAVGSPNEFRRWIPMKGSQHAMIRRVGSTNFLSFFNDSGGLLSETVWGASLPPGATEPFGGPERNMFWSGEVLVGFGNPGGSSMQRWWWQSGVLSTAPGSLSRSMAIPVGSNVYQVVAGSAAVSRTPVADWLLDPSVEVLVTLDQPIVLDTAETEWVRYPRPDEEESLGTPDGGVSVPALTGLDMDATSAAHIASLRAAVQALAGTRVNAVSGNLFNWSVGDADNLYWNAVDLGDYGHSGQAYDWARTGDVANLGAFDVDLGELADCVTLLEASTVAPGIGC